MDETPHELLFNMMAQKGYPQTFAGFEIVYYFKTFECDIKFNGTVEDKILKIREMVDE